MPKEIVTGYAAYCTEAARVFGDLFDGVGEDLAVSFATELLDEERFVSDDTSMRKRAWCLKGTWHGCDNRYKAFFRRWLDTERRDEIEALSGVVDDLENRYKAISTVQKWIKTQDGIVQRTLSVDRADEVTYRATMAELLQNVSGIVEKVTKLYPATPEDADAPDASTVRPSEFVFLLDYIGARLSGLASYLHTLETREGGKAAWRSWLDEYDASYLSPLAEQFVKNKKELSKEKKDASRQLEEMRNLEDCREEAISNCVEAMMAEDACLWVALKKCGTIEFWRLFNGRVVPAIKAGFRRENYSESVIAGFQYEIDDAASNLTIDRPDSKEQLRAFLRILVTALMFGPDSERPHNRTAWEDEFESFEYELSNLAGDQIVISQLLTADGAYVGNAGTFGADDVIFLGRCDVVESYITKLREVSPSNEEAELLLASRNPRVFVVPEANGQASNLHGMIVCEDEVWRYRDFSTYGTVFAGKGKGGDLIRAWVHHDYRELEAGCVLCLGATPNDAGDRLYCRAAALRVSFSLDIDRAPFMP